MKINVKSFDRLFITHILGRYSRCVRNESEVWVIFTFVEKWLIKCWFRLICVEGDPFGNERSFCFSVGRVTRNKRLFCLNVKFCFGLLVHDTFVVLRSIYLVESLVGRLVRFSTLHLKIAGQSLAKGKHSELKLPYN